LTPRNITSENPAISTSFRRCKMKNKNVVMVVALTALFLVGAVFASAALKGDKVSEAEPATILADAQCGCGCGGGCGGKCGITGCNCGAD
jgi:hypothetical protein